MNVNKLPGSKVQFEVVIPVDTFKKALDTAFEKKIKEIEVPGFRKGTCPRNVYESKFGVESLYDDALNEAISETYYQAVMENNIEICGYPHIDLDQKKINQEEPIHYFVTVSVYPTVELGEYQGLKIEKAKVSVSAKEVETEIKASLERDSMMVDKEDQTIAKGDTAKFDFEGFVDDKPFEGGAAKDYELEIGSGQFIPGFEDQMIGLKVGESKDLKVKFPDDYHSEELKGKDAIFKVTINGVKYREVPELTLDWVKEQKHSHDGKDLVFESVEDYKKHIKEHIKEHKEADAENTATNKLFEEYYKSKEQANGVVA
jgi:trigger factor